MRVLQYATIAAIAATSVNALDEINSNDAVDIQLSSGLPGCVWWCTNMQGKDKSVCELECAPKEDGEASEEVDEGEEEEETPVEEEEETPVEEEEETPVEEEEETPVEEEEETPVEEEEETPVEEEEETPVEEEEETPVEEEEETPVEEEEETPVEEEEETPVEEEEELPAKDDDPFVDLDDTDDADRVDDVDFAPKEVDDNPPEIDDHDEVFPREKHHPELAEEKKKSSDKWRAFLLPFGVASMLAGFGLLYKATKKEEKDETLTEPLNADNNA